jgi:hypothetical protein
VNVQFLDHKTADPIISMFLTELPQVGDFVNLKKQDETFLYKVEERAFEMNLIICGDFGGIPNRWQQKEVKIFLTRVEN